MIQASRRSAEIDNDALVAVPDVRHSSRLLALKTERNDDASITDPESYRAVGPFVFNKTEYWHVLNERAISLSGS